MFYTTGELKVLIFMENSMPYIVDKISYIIQHLGSKIELSTPQYRNRVEKNISVNKKRGSLKVLSIRENSFMKGGY